MKKDTGRYEWLVAALLFVATRWFVLLFNSGFALFITMEEMIYPTIAVERMRGNPLVEGMLYQGYTSGGFWLQTWLVMPFIRLLGCSRYAVKIVPIAFSLAAFLLYRHLARKYFGAFAARIFAAVMILGVPLLLHLQVVGYAGHNELSAFWAAGFLCLFWLLFEAEKTWRATTGAAFLLGLICTSSLFYCGTSLLFLGLTALVLPLIAFRLAGQLGAKSLVALPLFAGGLAIGYLPAIYLRRIVAHPFIGYYGHAAGSGFVGPELADKLRLFLADGNWARFIADVFIRLAGYRHPLFNVVFMMLVSFCAASALVYFIGALRRRDRKRPGAKARLLAIFQPDLLGPVLLALLIGISLVVFGVEWEPKRYHSTGGDSSDTLLLRYHQTVVLAPLMLLLIAATISRLWRAPRPRLVRLAKVLCVAVLLLGIVAAKNTTAFPRRPLEPPFDSCTFYWSLTEANISAIELRYGRENLCRYVEVYARSYDPRHRAEICAAIRKYSTCPCRPTGFAANAGAVGVPGP